MQVILGWLSNLMKGLGSSVGNLVPGFIQTAISGITGSPILVSIAAVLVGVGGFFLWRFVKPWLQGAKNIQNSGTVQSDTSQSSASNQSINDQVDDIFNRPSPPKAP